MSNRRLAFIILSCAMVLLLTCCGPGQILGPEFTPTPTSTLTPTPTSTITPTATQTNTPTPTRTLTPTGPEQTSWNDAWRKAGSVAKVCGEVVTVAILQDGRRVVNLGEIPSKGGVIIVITDATIFSENEVKNFYGKDICVTGEVTQDGTNYGIYVTNRFQISMDK